MAEQQTVARTPKRAAAAIWFAVPVAVLVLIAPALLWPVAAAAGLASLLLAWRSPDLNAAQRVLFSVVGVTLVAMAVLPPLDLYLSSVTVEVRQ